MKTYILLLILLIPCFSQAMIADYEIIRELKEHSQNPESYFLKEKKPSGKEVYSKTNEIKSKRFLLKSKPRSNDRVQDLLRHQNIEENLLEIDRRGLTSAKVDVQPWSDDYWPIYKGILANRYASDEFRETYSWSEARDYVRANPILNYSQEQINLLSPAEKYDLLISDHQQILTNQMWNKGSSYFERTGFVERWMGICHGWAPASFMVERPVVPVTVKSANGQFDLTFYPADLKALASLLWATGDYESNFVGGRCRARQPQLDDNDRPLATDCLDNNPVTFHLALVNQVGISKKSFVMDATYDYEVWNQPIVSYQYKYFNPITKNPTHNLIDATIDLENYQQDPYKDKRTQQATKLVGVTLEVVYAVETTPSQREFDSPSLDQTSNATYFYDIELDNNYKALGGEWYNLQHPDFLWLPAKNQKALTTFDYYLLADELWDGSENLSANVQDLAKRAAAQGMPLAYVVNSLLNLAK